MTPRSRWRRFAVVSVAVLAADVCAMRAASVTSSEPRSLAGLWAFHPGDDPTWAQPAFDDTSWTRIRVPGSWRRQGFDRVTGLAWYRLRVPSQWPADEVLGVTLGKIDSAYEVFVGGRRLGGVGEMPPAPRMEYDRHRTFSIPPAVREADGSVAIAVRVWRNPETVSTAGGPVEGPFEIGPLTRLVEHEKLVEARELALVFVFLLVAIYHLSLRIRLGSGDDYLWFGLLALLAAGYGFLRTQWKYLIIDEFVVLKKIEHLMLWLIPASILQFLWVFFHQARPRWLRGMQIGLIAGAAIVALTPGLLIALQLLSVVQLSVVPLVAAAMVLVVRRVRAGDREAPIVGLGMAVLAATVMHDALVDRNYIVDARVSMYGFAVLVVGMSVTLGNRFQRALRDRDALTRDLEGRVAARTRELNEAYRQMEQLALRDSLTQLLNRYAIVQRAAGELSRARRHRTPFALALIDVDDFKAINDSAGHAAGDAVLKQVAERLATAVRASDDVGRWGGDEFIVLLPGADRQEAASAAARLRLRIIDSPLALAGGASRRVTVSIGVVAVEGSSDDLEDLDMLVERADGALYRAKAEGRDGVRIANP
jgi:diguanylate cyclase (GGDEF)-like protein